MLFLGEFQRQRELFVSVADLLSRVPYSLSALDRLIVVRGLAGLNWNRVELLWQAHAHSGKLLDVK